MTWTCRIFVPLLSRLIQLDAKSNNKSQSQCDLERELTELRKENRLREGGDILKKAPNSLQGKSHEVRLVDAHRTGLAVNRLYRVMKVNELSLLVSLFDQSQPSGMAIKKCKLSEHRRETKKCKRDEARDSGLGFGNTQYDTVFDIGVGVVKLEF